MTHLVALTDYLQITKSGHILYFFEERSSYLKNLLVYIKTGVERGHHVLVIEDPTFLTELTEELSNLLTEESRARVHYVDNKSFYHLHQHFCADRIIDHFSVVLTPFFQNNMTIRTWSNVVFNEEDEIERKVADFEDEGDRCVNGIDVISVCAYDASRNSAYMQTRLMRNHEYLMTDHEFVRSTLYESSL